MKTKFKKTLILVVLAIVLSENVAHLLASYISHFSFITLAIVDSILLVLLLLPLLSFFIVKEQKDEAQIIEYNLKSHAKVFALKYAIDQSAILSIRDYKDYIT
jgi:hypothetical protein